jgi:hypothetical protein
MSDRISLRISGTEAQAQEFRDRCLLSEKLYAGTLINRLGIELTDDSADAVLSWFKTIRDMAVANWISSGLVAHCHSKPMPRIVCLCGSTRFWKTFQEASLQETMEGRIVLSIGAATGSDDDHFAALPADEYAGIKEALDELHKRKIDLADEILVLNVDNYIGDSTRSEIAYAMSLGKPVRWLSAPSEEIAKAFGMPTEEPKSNGSSAQD